MAVRIKIKIKIEIEGKSIETTALVNTGFESREREILLPEKLVSKIWPELLDRAFNLSYHTPAGVMEFKLLPCKSTILVITEDKLSHQVQVDKIVVSNSENEVLISDRAGEELGIEIIKLASGIWRFSDDPPGKRRESASTHLWTT